MNQPELILTPTDFVAIANQTLEFAFGLVKIEGELANFRVSKNRWVYFDIKDELAKIACFGSVYNLPGPLEDGMMVVISGQPRLHPQFGFSINIQSITPVGQGSIKKAYEILKAKLQAEGLFEVTRKRLLPYPPQNIALVTSAESAAYVDFIKILNNRWPFINIQVYDVQVQGEAAPLQLVEALKLVNEQANLADVVVITRGGGSADDLMAFDDERVVRAIAGSRVPTLVAIGHEVDVSLSELSADKRASTPSNAAELLAPDKKTELSELNLLKTTCQQYLQAVAKAEVASLTNFKQRLADYLQTVLHNNRQNLKAVKVLIEAYNPKLVIKRGYAVARIENQVIKSVTQVTLEDELNLTLSDGSLKTIVKTINKDRS